ncbi:MAG TPA: hypothetical protein VH186_36715 [Chloroflexia bacterium]|nr:hypothetical protein [Chloroflexia bacterium]
MTMLRGARSGRLTGVRRLISRIMPRSLPVFVVPDLEFVARQGLDLGTGGMESVNNPRQAQVLMVVGSLPKELEKAAALVYAQMPRPRLIFTIGEHDSSFLPPADAVADCNQESFLAGVKRLRQVLAEGAWQPDPPQFEPPVEDDDSGENDSGMAGMDHGMGGMDHSRMQHDKGGMDHSKKDQSQHQGQMNQDQSGEMNHSNMGHDMSGMDHSGMNHDMDHQHKMGHEQSGEMDHLKMDHSQHQGQPEHQAMGHDSGEMDHSKMGHDQPGEMDHSKMQHEMGEMDHSKMGHEQSGEKGHEMGSMDHSKMGHEMGGMHDMSGGGFMSMVAMTKDLPRSADGLPMEWSESPFGPLFRGLPGGLALTMTLDGEVVAGAKLKRGIVSRQLEKEWSGLAATFPERLSKLDPYLPFTYGLLACLALENAYRSAVDPATASARTAALERERILHHLGWFSRLGHLSDYPWLAQDAYRLQAALARAGEVARLKPLEDALKEDILRFVKMARPGFFLKQRFLDVGGLPQNKNGQPESLLELYRQRLAEIEQSIELLAAARTFSLASEPLTCRVDGHATGSAALETPRGRANLAVELQDDRVVSLKLETPSEQRVAALESVTKGKDLSDALLAVAALDLSPWELDR